jgi:hypothetical protein
MIAINFKSLMAACAALTVALFVASPALAGAGGGAVFFGDFHGDLDTDVLFTDETAGQVGIWFMDGSTIESGSSDNHPGVGTWVIIGAGFIDDDNKSDIVWRNLNTGQIFVWLIDGSTTPVGSGSLGFVDMRFDTTLGLADLDGSGTDDVVFQDSSDTVLAVFFTDGLNPTVGFEIGPPPANHVVAAFGNVNGIDGDDIIFEDTIDSLYGIWEFDTAGTIADGCGQSLPAGFSLLTTGHLNPGVDITDDFIWASSTEYFGWTMTGCGNGGIPGPVGSMGPVDARFGFTGGGDFDGDDNVDILLVDAANVLGITFYTGFAGASFEVGPPPSAFVVATNGQNLP